MAYQSYATTGISGFRRPRYTDQINSQRQFLPQMIQARADRKNIEDTRVLKEKEIGLGEQANALTGQQIAEMARSNAAQESYNASNLDLQGRQLAYEKDAAEKTAGTEMLKLGMNVATGPKAAMGGGLLDKATGAIGLGGGWSDSLRSAGAGALAGYGAAKMFGGKSKMKKLGAGFGAGLLTNFLSGGGFKSGIGAGAGGLLGGLFG